jgi:hypothetical protein
MTTAEELKEKFNKLTDEEKIAFAFMFTVTEKAADMLKVLLSGSG